MTGRFASLLRRNIDESLNAKQKLLEDSVAMECFEQAVSCVVNCYQEGGRLYIAGNGGSAADAQHLAAEFVSRFARDRNPLPAEALTTDCSILTAISNDYGYEHVFSRQLAAKLRHQDVFLGITTSGQSPNILRALEQCRQARINSIVFTGRGGGKASELTEYSINVPGERTSTIQELHIVLAHSLCEAVESELFPI